MYEHFSVSGSIRLLASQNDISANPGAACQQRGDVSRIEGTNLHRLPQLREGTAV